MIATGRIAQLVRAPRLHRGGQGFESLCAHMQDSLSKRSQSNPRRGLRPQGILLLRDSLFSTDVLLMGKGL